MSASLMVLHVLNIVAGLLVIAEAFNKLERTDLFDGRVGWLPRLGGLLWLLTPWRWKKPKLVLCLKLLAWACLAVGAAGTLASPLLHLEPPTLREVCVLVGFAILIVRSRLKEPST